MRGVVVGELDRVLREMAGGKASEMLGTLCPAGADAGWGRIQLLWRDKI